MRIRAIDLTIVEEGDDLAVVRLVHACDAPAWQEPARQAAKDTHGRVLDLRRAGKVT
jgi:hypothetical protein